MDSSAVYRHAHAAGALYAATVERELSVRLGAVWTTPVGRVPMRELAGIDPAVSARFSTRRAQVLERFGMMLGEWTKIRSTSDKNRVEPSTTVDAIAG